MTAVPSKLAAQDDAIFALITRQLIPFLFLCYLVAQVDRMNVGFAKLTMLKDLGFSDVVYGFGAGIFFIGYFLFEVPSNIALRRFGAPMWIGRIMVTWGILSVGMLFVRSEAAFYVLRFLIGAAEAGFFPGVIYYLTLWFPAQRRTRVIALFMSAIAVSGVVVGPVSGFVLQTMEDVGGLHGWQWLFLIEGLPAVVLGIVTMRRLPKTPNHAAWLDSDARARLAIIIQADGPQGAAAHPPLWAALANARTLWLSLVYGCYGMSFFGFVFWLPTIIQSAGVAAPLAIGLLSTIPWLIGTAAMLVVSSRASRQSDVRPILIGLALAAAAGWAASPLLLGNLPLAMVTCSLALAGTMGSLPLFWELPTAMFRGTAAAAAIALISALGNLPGFLSPFLVGWIKQATGSFDLPMYMFAAAMLVAAVVLFLLRGTPRDA
jgi:MFS family permease